MSDSSQTSSNSTGNTVSNPCKINTPESNRCLLKDSKTSILGDISINIGPDKYVLDRAMLVTKSNYFDSTELKNHDENHIEAMIAKVLENDSTRFSHIVDLIYGKELKSVLNEANFFQLFHDMNEMRMELDMEIFKQFIDENIKPKAKLYSRMFELYAYTSVSPKQSQEKLSDYLLSTISLYFSDRLVQIYEMEQFLSLPAKAFILILFNKSQNLSEKRLIARICAEWICYDFQNRIKELIGLVNATRYRFGVTPYCIFESEPLIKSLRKNNMLDKPEIQKIEKSFEQLVFYHSEVQFASTSDLKDELCKINPGPRIVNPIDQPTKWMSLLETGTFCDFFINIQGTNFKLHRIKLAAASGYFYNLYTNPPKPSIPDTENNSTTLKSTTQSDSFDQIDAATFQTIIHYIYKQEIEVTSSQRRTLNKIFQFLKIDTLYDKYNSTWLSNLDHDLFKKFEFVCKNDKSSERYDSLVEKIISLWPKLDQSPQFKDISLYVLREILALPQLQLDDPDEILDLCSEWIFYDFENRYYSTIEVAQAINRNFIVDSDQIKLEIPLNSADYSKHYVKEQLSKILSSTRLVSLTSDCNQDTQRKPRFLFFNQDNVFSILDVNFDEIVQIVHVDNDDDVFDYAATMLDNKLFLLFNIGDKFHFQAYYPSSNRIVSLAVDERMHSNSSYDIFNCKGEIYLWLNKNTDDDSDEEDDVDAENKTDDGEDEESMDSDDVDTSEAILLKYCFKLNRWITFLHDNYEGQDAWYTSDSKRLYRIYSDNFDKEVEGWRNKLSVLDLQNKTWIPLPDIPIITQLEDPNGEEQTFKNDKIGMNVLNQNLSILFGSKTFVFSWVSQKWTEISNVQENFVELTTHDQNVIFISREGEVYWYSPSQNKWTFRQKLEKFNTIYAILQTDE